MCVCSAHLSINECVRPSAVCCGGLEREEEEEEGDEMKISQWKMSHRSDMIS